MSDLGPPPQPTGIHAASLIGSSVVGLFIQGFESGLVLSEFSRWFSRDRREKRYISVIVVFVTIIGLLQSGLYFASAWTTFVEKHGDSCANWEDNAQLIPNLLISVPIQSLMIQRCYQIMGKNRFIVTLLVLLLVASTVMSFWSIVLFIDYLILPSLRRVGIAVSWPYLLSVLLPSILDIILTGIMLYHLVRKKKQVFSAHIREQVSRFVNIMWQCALPPTLCAMCLSGLYIRFTIAGDINPRYWLTAIQPATGKLYVLSLFYLLNTRPLQQFDERAPTFISTFTVPMEVGTIPTVVRGTRVGGDECSEVDIAGRDYVHEKTGGFAV